MERRAPLVQLATVEVGRDRVEVRAREVEGEQLERLWRAMVDGYPDTFRCRGERRKSEVTRPGRLVSGGRVCDRWARVSAFSE